MKGLLAISNVGKVTRFGFMNRTCLLTVHLNPYTIMVSPAAVVGGS